MEKEKKTVLMIENDDFLRSLYRERLEKENFNFIEATNGIEGTNKIMNENPDLIVTDLLLPLKGGFDILEEMNESGLILKIPVIILSNLRQESDIEEGRQLKAKDYFIKSEASFSEVIKRIKELL